MSDLIVITGASSDIGMALARRLLGTAETMIIAHSFAGGERIATLQEEFGAARIISVAADLSDRGEIEAFAGKVLSVGVPRAFVHLPASRLQHERFTKLDWTKFARDMTVQVESAGTLLQRWLPKMAKSPGSRVVFLLSSVTFGIPPKFMSAYTIAKYAQLGLMRALAAEYGSSQVRINAIAPSMVETQFLSDITEIAVQMSASASPLGRNATTRDLMEAFELLLSERVEYIHGISLPITGGATT